MLTRFGYELTLLTSRATAKHAGQRVWGSRQSKQGNETMASKTVYIVVKNGQEIGRYKTRKQAELTKHEIGGMIVAYKVE